MQFSIQNKPLAQQNRAWAAIKLVAIGVAFLALPIAHAQAPYPSKPVTIIVPFAAGGGTDLGARLLAQKLTAKWGQSVVVDNKGGAGGIVGVEAVVRSKPDGYTLLVGNVGTQSINPALYKKLPYDHDKAFTPIAQFAELPFFALTRPGLPAKNIAELMALAKQEPGKISYASSGNGGSPHLSGEIFQSLSGTKLLHVPYKGGGPAMVDLIAGHVDILFASVLESIGHVKSGKLRAIAVTTSARSSAMPDVPTVAESGLPGFDSGSWLALLGPAGMPQELVNKIAADVKAVIDDPATRQALEQQGATPHSSTPAQLAALVDADRKRYTKIITDKNISLE
jgi:tripartite-type tricarboxylate transporter receptor subunit TctC